MRPIKRNQIVRFGSLGRMMMSGLLVGMLLCANVVLGQGKGLTVSGTVRDLSGQVLPGASVSVKGTSTFATTNNLGQFTIPVPSSESVVAVSLMGHRPVDITVGNKTSIEVVLEDDFNEMEDLVVVGFGTQKRENLTGAVGTTDAKTFENRPVTSAVQALQGMIPGLNIASISGTLDSKPDMNIRGIPNIGPGSIGAPLILIDGMEADINSVNPQDIESVSVLKDAASSSIYGSRAPFGVILITTKKGQKGKTTLSYTNNLRWSDPIIMPKTMDSYTFALTMNEGYKNGGHTPLFDDDHIQRIRDYQSGALKESVPVNPNNPSYWMDGYYGGNDNVDYFKEVYRSWAFSQDHNLSLSGANDKLGYYASLNYLDQNGLMRFNQDKYERFSTNVKLNAEVTPWATFSTNTRFMKDNYGRPSMMTDGLYGDILRQGWPTLPMYDPNGNMYCTPSAPLKLRDGGRGNYETETMYQQFQFNIRPLEGWNINAEYNFRTTNTDTSWDIQQLSNHDVDGNPYVYYPESHVHNAHLRDNFHNVNIFSDYTLDLQNGHRLKFMAGFQSELFKIHTFSAQRDGIIISSLPEIDLTSGFDPWGDPKSAIVSGSRGDWATAGFFGRVNYDYKERYLVEVNARYDGTSRFRKDKRWHTFISASAGWNVAKEEFWNEIKPYVSTLKPRVSYGELGNQNTTDFYPTYSVIQQGTANGNWIIGGTLPNTAGSPTLISTFMTWERSKTWNFGVDIAAFKNRLTTSFDYYIRETLDMIGSGPERPATLGIAVPVINNADLKTLGWELSVAWRDRLNCGLGYGVTLLLSDARTEVTRYANETGSLGTFRKGQQLGEIWGYTTLGIAQTQQQMDDHLATMTNGGQDDLGADWRAGDIMYADRDNDGKIGSGAYTIDDHGDLTIIGNETPRYRFGVDISADYKGFDFRAFFQGVMKRDYFADNFSFWGVTNDTWSVAPTTNHLDYFRAEAVEHLGQNLNSYFPRPVIGSNKNQQVQTKYLQNAAYLRLKNVQLGYTLPASITQKAGIAKLRIYASAENVFTVTKMFKMYDPETVGGGWGAGVYPLSRVISFGVNVNF